MKFASLAIAGLLLTAPELALADPWDRTDTYLLGGAVGVLAIDWSQTRKLTSLRETRVTMRDGVPVTDVPNHEYNPILGPTPTNAQINRYFIVAIGATVGLAYVLPKPYRRLFLGGLTVVEAAVIIQNDHVGLRLSF